MKVRVYELAKELGTNSKDLLQVLNDMGEFVRSGSSTLDAPVVRRLQANWPGAQAAQVPSRPLKRTGGSDAKIGRVPRPMALATVAASPPEALRPESEPTGSAAAPKATRSMEVAVDVALALHRVEVDAVELIHRDNAGFRLRVDKVSDDRAPLWLSTWLLCPEDFASAPSGPLWMTLRKWTLPLVPLAEPANQLPGLGVLQLPDVQSAAAMAEAIASALLGTYVGSVRISVEECDPGEANRRLGVSVLIHRRHGNGGRKRFAETTCLKCGLPLSDPTSVKIGIGPECRSKLGKDAIHALRSSNPVHKHVLGACRPKTWVAVVARRFADLTRAG